VQEGNRLYEEGRFEEAHQKYLEALAAAPESGVIRFNDGNALYQSEDHRRAMEAYQQAIETGDPALASSAWYNLGNALFRQQQFPESLEAYKQALRLSSTDRDAKHNLERVLELMQEQEQQEQDPQDEQEEPQEDEQQQQQDEQQPEDDPQEQDREAESQPQDQEAQEEQGEPQPEPGQMTPEEAERLLDAIDEDPEDVDRRRAPATGRRPRKPW